MKTEQHISVRNLIHFVLSSGDLEQSFTGRARSVGGISAHRLIQKNRPELYIPEVRIHRVFDIDGFSLTVTGRIDGVYQYPDRTVIDEIKTVRDTIDMEQGEDGAAWAQVKCYAYLYCLEQGLSKIDAQLTFYQVDTGATREIRRTYSFVGLEIFFRDLLARYIEWARTLKGWGGRRDRSILELEFPFDRYRSGQREMSQAVYRAVTGSDQVLVRAATGIGKTMAALFPSIKAIRMPTAVLFTRPPPPIPVPTVR